MHRLPTISLLATLVAGGACGSSNEGGTRCDSNQVEIAYLGGTNERSECHPIPAACGAQAKCADLACTRALFELCQAPAIGVGCSDTFQPAIVSCNE